MIRLDRFIADNTHYSRTEVKRLIGEDRVKINGELAHKANHKIDSANDAISLDNNRIEIHGHVYLILNKPKGYVSATKDAEHPTVIDLLHQKERFLGDSKQYLFISNTELQIVGRLDKDTTGLLLLTTDGDWNHRISSPNSGHHKTYAVELAEPICEGAELQFQQGIQLKNEAKLTKPATLQIQRPTHALITICEGRYHQVKRMFAAIGNRVIQLERVSIGTIKLDEDLKPGYFRSLSNKELNQLGVNLKDHK